MRVNSGFVIGRSLDNRINMNAGILYSITCLLHRTKLKRMDTNRNTRSQFKTYFDQFWEFYKGFPNT